MDNEEAQVEMAAAAIAALNKMHQEFMGQIAKQLQLRHPAGSIKLEGDRLSMVCLGIPVQVVHRPVSRKGTLAAMEYTFLVEQGRDEQAIWHVYLDGDGTLHTDSERKSRFCDFNNSYVVKNLLVALSEVLLKSSIFKPSV